MKISAHVNVTNPKTMGYPYLESLRSFANVADEVIVVDGGSTDGSLEEMAKIDKVRIVQGNKWERFFDWTILARNLQIGYDNCQYKWAFKFDIDYIFHEKDVVELKEALAGCDLPALEIRKCNFVTTDRYFRKDYYPFIVNKQRYKILGYGIGRSVGGPPGSSFLWPIAINERTKDGLNHGEFVKMSNMRVCRKNVPIYTYDFTFMTKEQVTEQRVRFESSLQRHHGRKNFLEPEYRGLNVMLSTMKHRYGLCEKEGVLNVKLEDHSKFIRDRVANIKPKEFGYNMWE